VDVFLLKLIAALVLLLVGLGGGLAPLRLRDRSGSRTLFALSNAFAGGVFLGAGLIHMLPDAVAGFRAWMPGVAYPLASLLAALGFGMVLCVERVLWTSSHGAEGEGSRFTPFLLAVALGVHSLLAGLALGAQETAAESVVIFLALLLHKGSAGFALGVSFVRHDVEARTAVPAVAVFATTTPLGILLAAVVGAAISGTARLAFESIFDALAAGTFLYIATLDVILEEFSGGERRLLKFVSLLSGLGLMALVALWL
jgi:zinc transporter 1/2/3